MAENMPVNFAIPNENISVNYDWTDLNNNTGYQTFYGYLTSNNTPAYILSVKQLTVVDTLRIYNVNYLNFESSTINAPMVLNGDAIITIKHKGGAGTADGNYYCTIYKKSNGVNTAICTETYSGTVTGTADTNVLLKVALTQTNLKKGDSIVVGLKYTGNNGDCYHNSPPITVYLPFKIDK